LREGFNEIEDTDEAENFEDAITARGVDSNIEKTKAVKIEEAENFIDDSDVPANEKITDEAAISIAKAENLDGPLKNTKSNKDTIPQTDTETDIEATETQTQDVQKVNSDPTTQTEVGEVEEIEEAVGFNDDSVVPANETKAEGAEMVIAETENINDTPAEAETESQDEQKVNNTLNTQSKPNDLSTVPDINDGRPEPSVYPFVQMKYLLKRGNDVRGKTFRINGIDFEKGQYIITPEITLRLNLLVDVLEKYPNLSIEIGAYSNSIGDDAENLEVTKARAGAIAAHLINQGISTDRINADGYGETQLLNHCSNGVKCNEKEQNINERVEIYVF